jgi:hypothetical protein
MHMGPAAPLPKWLERGLELPRAELGQSDAFHGEATRAHHGTPGVKEQLWR